MRQYLDILRAALERGYHKGDPQGVGNRAIFGERMRFDLSTGEFPLVTTRDLSRSFRGMTGELLWFLSGSTSLDDLHRHYGIKFWDQWGPPSEEMGFPPGELGPIYGKQWRSFDGGGPETVDQITQLVERLKNNPDSRRHRVTNWNPVEVEQVFIAPCHGDFYCFHGEGELSLMMIQRSADLPVGVPFNIAEYALLLLMLAQITGLKAKDYVHVLADAHVYNDQAPLVPEQLEREPRPLPRVRINPDVKDLFAFTQDDFELVDYEPHPPIRYPVAL